MEPIVSFDSYFVIGGLHLRQNKPCQDHALGGSDEASAYIAVSDGCSSGRHTDIGARIMTTTALITLKRHLDIGGDTINPSAIAQLNERIRIAAEANKHMLGLTTQDMQATCLYALVTAQGGFIQVVGDGVVILKYLDSSMDSYEFKWQENRPYYLAYQGQNLRQFITDHEQVENAEKALCVTIRHFDPEGNVTIEQSNLSVRQAIEGYSIVINQSTQERLEDVIICSDGLESFHTEENEVDLESVIRNISAFKTSKGEFIKRRVSRMLADFSKEGIEASDDLACAAIHINHSERKAE